MPVDSAKEPQLSAGDADVQSVAQNAPDLDSSLREETNDLDALLDAVQKEMELGLEDAVAKAGQVIDAARLRGSHLHEGSALHLRGWARFGTGDMLGALQDQLAAVELLTTAEDEQGVGRCLHALGAIYDTIGEPSVALEHYQQAIEVQSRVGDAWGEARTRNGLAVIMAQDERYGEASAAFLEVADRFEAVGDDWWVLMARINRAVTLLEQVQTGALKGEAARELCRELLAECDTAIRRAAPLGQSGVSVALYARQCRAGLLHELHDPEASLREIELALPMATRAGDATIIVDLQMHAARALESLGGSDEVFTRLDDAEELARSAGRDRHVTQCLELRAKICEGRGDLAGALAAYQELHQQKTRARRQAEDMRAKVVRSLLDTQRAEHELQLARAEVENLEALGRERRRMVSVIAHELRNPITTVLGISSELCRSWDELGDEGRGLIELVRDEAEDVANIVEDLLAADSIERGSLQVDVVPSELGPILVSVLETSPLDDKVAKISGNAWVLADPVRVRQILRNLVSNAVRYGGDQIIVEVVAAADTVAIEVRDNGDGVPAADAETIFEPYRRASSGEHGTNSVGLGLSVTRQLARLMSGDVRYERCAGETVFRLRLPAADPATQPS